jgi:LPXTG-motif cell wall-anchored protein
MNTYLAYTLTASILFTAALLLLLPATGAGSNPALFIAILVIATLAIIGGILLLRRKPRD